MAKYAELIAKIDDAFQNDKKLEIKAKDIEYLSAEEINNLQQKINAYNFEYINTAEKKGMIDSAAAEYLKKICANPSKIINDMVQKISHSILQKYRAEKVRKLEELGEEIAPDEINAIDLHIGKIEENVVSSTYRNMPKNKEYQTKHITPFTSMRLTFYDFRDNPLYLIMPGMKDIRRAIDKIKMPVYDKKGNVVSRGGKYYEQFQKDQKKIRTAIEAEIAKKYSKGTEEYAKALQEAEPEIQKKINKLSLPHERLKDIFRFTICRKYYQDTEESLQLFANDPQYAVDKKEIKDTFHGNQNVSSAYETKNYREKRLYLTVDGVKIEVQIKITKLYEGDVITHDIYAGVENNESRNDNILLISHQNTKNNGTRFWEENKGRYLTEGDKKIVEMRILEKQMEAQRVNKQKIREANLQVLDKAFRLEDAKRANGKDFDAQSINPINRKEQKIHRIVAKFIQDNFMYRPFKAFDMKQKFNVTDKELKSLGLVITKAQLDDLFNRYAEFILPKYNGRIDGTEAAYFNKAENQKHISAMFKKDAPNEQPEEDVLPDTEEQEMMQELDKTPLNAQKYNKILAKKQSYYHNKQQQVKRIINAFSAER